jgi:hypothetical protein
MATQNISAPYDVTLRRGRITLLAIIILIAASEIAIVALTLGLRGWQTGWRAGFGAVLTFVLLRALYKGYEAARWLTIVLLVMLFAVLLTTAFNRTELTPWVRLGCGWLAGMYAGSAILLARSRPIKEFLGRAVLRRFAAERLFDKDGRQLFRGKVPADWLSLAGSPDAGQRREAVEGLKSVLEDVENADCERALLHLARDREEPVRYDALAALRYGDNLIRQQRAFAIEVMQSIRAQPLSEGARLFMTEEDPDTIKEHFADDSALEAASRSYAMFDYSGEILRRMGVDPNRSPESKDLSR